MKPNRFHYASNESPRQVSYGELFDFEDLGFLSSAPPERSVSLWCNKCRVRWTGCQDAAECPKCGDTTAYELTTQSNFDGGERTRLAPVEAETNNRTLCQTRDDPPSDICKNRHGGNPQSTAAFQSVKERLSQQQERVFRAVEASGDRGMTNSELCEVLGTTPNCVSPRLTELKIAGRIEKIGVRLTRSGCNAAIWKTKSP